MRSGEMLLSRPHSVPTVIRRQPTYQMDGAQSLQLLSGREAGGDISYRNPGKRKWGNYINQFAFGHNISSLYLPPEKYFRKHPEYYSLVNGKRKQWAQLCFTNREMEKIIRKCTGYAPPRSG